MKLIREGFFRELPYGYEDGGSLLNSIGKFRDEKSDKILKYLRDGRLFIMSPGLSRDFFSKEKSIIGSLCIRTDGRYAWPSDLEYYFEKYHVKISEEFLDHMQAVNWTIEDFSLNQLEL